VYFPQKKYPFYRVGVYSNIMPSMAPAGCASFYVEVSHVADTGRNEAGEIEAVTRGLYESRMLSVDDRIEFVEALPIECAYVIFDAHRKDAVTVIDSWLRSRGIYSIGRYGAWEYSFMEKNIIDGIETARMLNVCR
jgi:protoporphyrinogen oxidase